MFVGFSTKHASSVPLVFNPETVSITPQFHVVFDDWFATVGASAVELPDFNSDAWYKLFCDSVYQYVLDEGDLSAIGSIASNLQDNISSTVRSEQVTRALDHHPFSYAIYMPHVPNQLLHSLCQSLHL